MGKAGHDIKRTTRGRDYRLQRESGTPINKASRMKE